MPATEYQGSPFSSIGRSILSNRREQVHAMDAGGHGELSSAKDHELECFQRHVAEHFAALSAAGDVLSLSWIRKLLDSFLLIQEEFRVILLNNRPLLSRPPLDRLVSDFFERTVKALDVCNAIRDGIDQVRQWRNHLEIVVAALNPDQKTIGEGQIRRAKKALTDLTILMLDEKDAGSVLSHRNRSFGRSKDHHRGSGSGGSSGSSAASHFRSLSWSVSRSWSAARQLQAIGANLSAPRSAEIVATCGIVVPIYTMNSVLLFVMFALVAAIPCQDRGLQAHFSAPRHFPWAASISTLHEKILEESKKRDRKNASGLLKETQSIERCTRHLIELTDNAQSAVGKEKECELREKVTDLKEVCNALKDGLEPLERQVREVFHRIVRSRTDGLDCLSQNSE